MDTTVREILLWLYNGPVGMMIFVCLMFAVLGGFGWLLDRWNTGRW